MNSLHSIVASREFCQQFRKAGWPQEDQLFYWFKAGEEWALKPAGLLSREDAAKRTTCAAPTCEEILRRLPSQIQGTDGQWYYLQVSRGETWFNVIYFRDSTHQIGLFSDLSLANAAAAMLVFLNERNLLPS